MNETQKVIKYVAIAVAAFLAFSIITGIVTGILTIFGISSVIDVLNNNVETMNYTKEYVNINSIEMDIAATELVIQKAEVLKIEGEALPTDYKFEEKDGILKIKNKKVAQNSKLVVYIPNDMLELDIDIGAGKIQIEDIKVSELNLDTGAAVTSIKKLNVVSSADIDAGVGEIVIEDSDIYNLDMDAGVGTVEYSGYLRGTSDIDCGVGNININLSGTDVMYKIIAEKGIGELEVNGNKLSGTQTLGNGSNVIKLSGGIGSLNIEY